MPGKLSPIPVFDLAEGIKAGDLLDSCREYGCFSIRSPRLEPVLTQELLQGMHAFFSLEDDNPVKLAAHRSRNAGANGWTPLLEEPAYEAGTISWVESFDCVLSRQRLESLPATLVQGIRPSIWPPMAGFRDVVRAHWDALIETAAQLYPLISVMLEQTESFLSERASSQALNTMRLLHYPENKALSDEVNRGISAHTDFECITLIHQTAPGLQVQTPHGEWLEAPVATGQWTVLIGDMVERWSNGAIPATPHRVPNTGWERYSIVMFMAADPGIEVRPLENFIGEQRPAAFQPVTQDELIRVAMARAEANRQAMLPQVERIRGGVSPG